MNIKTEIQAIIWKIVVEVGQEIEENQEVIILESMKMEIPINSNYKGKIKEILVKEGDMIDEDEIVIILE
jgi:acetyl-CoA carboxylase biotin carboxyl carrier protein|tara:strand:+ start:485 stop:694 length:210 start_codon:yes stop_codon:yes gene_type:complete